MPAPRAPDGRFYNPWPQSEPHGARDMVQWSAERRRTRLAPSPPRGSLPTSTPAIVERVPSGLVATWVGHSTTLLQANGLNLLTDPMFSERASPVQWAGPRRLMAPGVSIESLPPIDVVLLSHNHYDHLDRRSVRSIAARFPAIAWVVPLGVGATIRRFGARDIVELDWWGEAEVKGMRVTGTPARHFSARGLRDRNRSLWSGFAVDAGSVRFWFAGDTAYHQEFTRVGERGGPFDFVMVPIGAYEPRWFMRRVHVDPDEAVQIYRDVAASHPAALPTMLAIHWGTFRLTDEPMDEPPRRVTDAWRAAGLPGERLWVPKFGETRAIVDGGTQ